MYGPVLILFPALLLSDPGGTDLFDLLGEAGLDERAQIERALLDPLTDASVPVSLETEIRDRAEVVRIRDRSRAIALDVSVEMYLKRDSRSTDRERAVFVRIVVAFDDVFDARSSPLLPGRNEAKRLERCAALAAGSAGRRAASREGRLEARSTIDDFLRARFVQERAASLGCLLSEQGLPSRLGPSEGT